MMVSEEDCSYVKSIFSYTTYFIKLYISIQLLSTLLFKCCDLSQNENFIGGIDPLYG